MLISRKMNKPIVVYSHNGIQNINTNKQTVSTHDNINVSHKQNTEPKNPGQKKKNHIRSTHTKFNNGKTNLHCQITEKYITLGCYLLTRREHKGSFWGNENVLFLDLGLSYTSLFRL